MKQAWTCLAILLLLPGLVGAAAPEEVAVVPESPGPHREAIPGGSSAPWSSVPASRAGIESVSGSFVVFDPTVGGDLCYTPGVSQTFCFRAESFTNDWDYIYYLWQLFPDDWTVTDAYVQGTPYCVNGGTFAAFSWWGVSDNEVRITHIRYHANPGDQCVAYYCFEVTPGSGLPGSPDALESWYWISSGCSEFPSEAPFSASVPLPDSADPAGAWAEWDIGDLAMGQGGKITVTVLMTDSLTPGDSVQIPAWIYDHVDGEADGVVTVFIIAGEQSYSIYLPLLLKGWVP
jgi:hypothetical protein